MSAPGTLGALAARVRSKNAGPFWLTLDVFFDTPEAFETASRTLDTGRVAALFGAAPERVRRFDIAALRAIKISLPRPAVQGSTGDRDMHGAAAAHLLAALPVTAEAAEGAGASEPGGRPPSANGP